MSYWDELPETEDLRERLQYAWEYWQERNKFINKIRMMLSGDNTIEAPSNTPYKIRTVHTYSFAAIVNEKAARFTQLPLIQIVPENEEHESRRKSSRIERAINMAFREIERRSDGDVWSRTVIDAICIDEGVERIERAPGVFWKDVVTIDDDGNVTLPFSENDPEQTLVKRVKRSAGIPIRTTYVPLENFYPIYEGPTLLESFETEIFPLRVILNEKKFAGSRGALAAIAGNEANNLKAQVTIVQYVNPIWHAYYAMTPGTANNAPWTTAWPNLSSTELQAVGTPMLLYAYKHNLGQSIYNCIPGRFGGWKTSHNRIEGINKGILEISQRLDEVTSQVLTNVRAKYWPSLKQKINPDLRGYEDAGAGTQGEPKAIKIPEGQSIAIYLDEDIEPLFKPVDDPAVPWLFDQLQNQLSRLGGSPVLFGQRTPGVETGYHQSLQITQAEHLDEKIEQHLSVGAARRAELIFRHIKAMNLGSVPVTATETSPSGKKRVEVIELDPNDLYPLPLIDAQVRRPRPVDLAASIRAALEATSEREGKGPLLSDDTVRESFLNITEPDTERHKVLLEAQQNRLVASGVLDAKIAQQLNLLLAVEGMPQVTDPTAASPASLEAVRQLAGGGSASPPPSEASPGITPGMPTGQSQPEQAAGRGIGSALYGNGVTAGV